MDYYALKAILNMETDLRALRQNVEALPKYPVPSYWEIESIKSIRVPASRGRVTIGKEYGHGNQILAIAILVFSFQGITHLYMSSQGHALNELGPDPELLKPGHWRWPAKDMYMPGIFLPCPITLEWELSDEDANNTAFLAQYVVVESVTPNVL